MLDIPIQYGPFAGLALVIFWGIQKKMSDVSISGEGIIRFDIGDTEEDE